MIKIANFLILIPFSIIIIIALLFKIIGQKLKVTITETLIKKTKNYEKICFNFGIDFVGWCRNFCEFE
jgi:hypothetical protein